MPFKISCLPVLDKFHCCCCSCRLKSATIALGWIQMVASIIQLAWFSAYLIKPEEITLLFGLDLRHICIGLASEAAVLVLCCLFLLVGAHKEKPGFMVPYLVVCQLGIGLLILITFISGFSVLFRLFIIGLGIIMGGSTVVIIASYLWLVMYSYYRTLVQKSRRSRTEKGEVSTEKSASEQEVLT